MMTSDHTPNSLLTGKFGIEKGALFSAAGTWFFVDPANEIVRKVRFRGFGMTAELYPQANPGPDDRHLRGHGPTHDKRG
jgi:hypothetical protein